MSSKISELLNRTTVTGDEDIPVALDGQNFRVKVSLIKGATDKAGVGLPLVDNTPDLDKPISNLTQQALDDKSDSDHQHAISEISGLTDALDGKAETQHGHGIADVSGLAGALSGKANSSHGHDIADISGLQDAIDSKAETSHTHSKSAIIGLNDDLISLQNQVNDKAPNVHSHNPIEISGLNAHIVQVVTDAGFGTATGDVEVGDLDW